MEFSKSIPPHNKLIFSCAQAARAPSFSAARERRQRDRKGGNHVKCTPIVRQCDIL